MTTTVTLTSLSFLAGLLLELLKLLFVFGLDFKLHLGQLDLIFILRLGDLLLEHRAVVLPLSQFELVKECFASDVGVCVVFFPHLLHGHLACFQFSARLCPQFLNVVFHVLHRLVRQFLIFFLKVQHFVAQDEQLLHLGSVRHRQMLHYLLLFLHLLFPKLNKTVVLGADSGDFSVAVSYQVLKLLRVTKHSSKNESQSGQLTGT